MKSFGRKLCNHLNETLLGFINFYGCNFFFENYHIMHTVYAPLLTSTKKCENITNQIKAFSVPSYMYNYYKLWWFTVARLTIIVSCMLHLVCLLFTQSSLKYFVINSVMINHVL